MAQISDLTWQQVETGSGLLNLIEVHPTEGLKIRISAVLGNVSTDKNSAGVVKFMHILREACAAAEKVVNTNQQIGDRLGSFPPSSSGTPVEGYVTTSGQIISKQPINNAGTIGVNV